MIVDINETTVEFKGAISEILEVRILELKKEYDAETERLNTLRSNYYNSKNLKS